MDSNAVSIDEPLVELKDEQINGELYMMASASLWHSNIVSNIHDMIKRALGDRTCRATKEDVDFKYHPNCDNEKLRGDYVCPDIMIMCDRSKAKGGAYYGVPKFIAEVLSPSTAHKDSTTKMRIYEEAGVSEYWMVSADTVYVYYLADDKYCLERTFVLCDDKEDREYNASTIITLREFPQVSMTLGEIFEDTWV